MFTEALLVTAKVRGRGNITPPLLRECITKSKCIHINRPYTKKKWFNSKNLFEQKKAHRIYELRLHSISETSKTLVYCL